MQFALYLQFTTFRAEIEDLLGACEMQYGLNVFRDVQLEHFRNKLDILENSFYTVSNKESQPIFNSLEKLKLEMIDFLFAVMS